MWGWKNDNVVSSSLLRTRRTFDYELVTAMLSVLKGTRTGSFLDIGANIGSWAVPVRLWQERELVKQEASDPPEASDPTKE